MKNIFAKGGDCRETDHTVPQTAGAISSMSAIRSNGRSPRSRTYAKPFGTTRSLPNTEITTEPLRILSVRIVCRLTATTTIRMRNANGKPLQMWKRLFRASRST